MPSAIGDSIMSLLRGQLSDLVGQQWGDNKVAIADDFSYHDPVDGSISPHQGVRIIFTNGSRIVFRLSGTGTEGATLRIYLERFEPDAKEHGHDPQKALADLIELAEQLGEVRARSNMKVPTVIT